MQERDGDISFLDFAPVFLGRQRWVVVKLVLALCLSALNFPAHAQITATWTGKSKDPLWSNRKNWDTRTVPGSNDTAIINLSGSNLVILDTNVAIGSIDLGGDGTNILQLSGASIQCSGSISISNNAILEITGNSSVAGGSVQNSGTIMVPANLGTQSLTLMSYFTNYGVLDAETNSVLSLSDTNSVNFFLNASTSFTGSGAVQLAGNQNINCSANMTVNGTVELANAGILADSTWSGPGLFRWFSGTISNVTFAPGFNVEFDGSGSTLVAGSCTNQGTIRWLPGTIGIVTGSTNNFYNIGTVELDGDCEISGGGFFSAFQNSGTITVPANAGVVSFTINSGFLNYGAFDVGTNSTLEFSSVFNGAPQGFLTGTSFNGPGIVQLPPESPPGNESIPSEGTIYVNTTVTIDGGIFGYYGNTIVTGSGLLRLLNGALMFTTFDPDFHVEIDGGLTLSGSCTNLGTIRLFGGNFSGDPTFVNTFYNAGLFEIETNCELVGLSGPSSTPLSFLNTGTIEVPANLGELTLTNSNCDFTNYGTVDVESNSTFDIVTSAQNPGIIDFESGTVFAGPGTLEVLPTSTSVLIDGSIGVNGVVEINAISYLGGGTFWNGTGLLRLANSQLTDTTFGPELTVEVDGNLSLFGTCTNQGTIHWFNGAISTEFWTNFQFYNSGLIQIETTNCLLGPGGNFLNSGTLDVSAGLGEIGLIDLTFTNYSTIDVETNSTLDIGGADFESGTHFAGPGTVHFPQGTKEMCHGSMTVDGTLVNESALEGPSYWTGPGLIKWTYGWFGSFTLAPDMHLEISGPDFKWLYDNCTNQGTITLLGGGQLQQVAAGFAIDGLFNSGTILVEGNCTLFGFSPGVFFQNTGTIKTPSNLGELSLINFYSLFTNYGTIDVESNSTLDLFANSAVSDFESGTLFAGPGTVQFPANSGATCNGSMVVNGTLDLDSRLSGSALWSGSGLFRWLGGVMLNETFEPGFQVEIDGSDPKYVEYCTNQGTIRWLSGNSLNDPMTSGEFYNSGLIQIETNGTWYSIAIDNEPSGTFRQLVGQLSVQSITNCGTVDLRTGTLNVANFFSGSNSTYQLTLSGTTPGTNFNQLTAQSLALNGALQVAFSNGFAPANGSSFTIANDSSQSGTFASLTPSTIPPTLALNLAYSPTTVILDVVPAFFGLTNSVYTNGSFQFSLNGNPAGSYDIQSSSNLTDWTTVGTNSPFTGSVNFTDTNAASPGQRFYRARIYP